MIFLSVAITPGLLPFPFLSHEDWYRPPPTLHCIRMAFYLAPHLTSLLVLQRQPCTSEFGHDLGHYIWHPPGINPNLYGLRFSCLYVEADGCIAGL